MQQTGRGGRIFGSTAVGLLIAESAYFDPAPIPEDAIKIEDCDNAPPPTTPVSRQASPKPIASSSHVEEPEHTGASEPPLKRKALGDATNTHKPKSEDRGQSKASGSSTKTKPNKTVAPQNRPSNTGEKRKREGSAATLSGESAMLDFINAGLPSRPDCRRKVFSTYYGNDDLGTHALLSQLAQLTR